MTPPPTLRRPPGRPTPVDEKPTRMTNPTSLRGRPPVMTPARCRRTTGGCSNGSTASLTPHGHAGLVPPSAVPQEQRPNGTRPGIRETSAKLPLDGRHTSAFRRTLEPRAKQNNSLQGAEPWAPACAGALDRLSQRSRGRRATPGMTKQVEQSCHAAAPAPNQRTQDPRDARSPSVTTPRVPANAGTQSQEDQRLGRIAALGSYLRRNTAPPVGATMPKPTHSRTRPRATTPTPSSRVRPGIHPTANAPVTAPATRPTHALTRHPGKSPSSPTRAPRTTNRTAPSKTHPVGRDFRDFSVTFRAALPQPTPRPIRVTLQAPSFPAHPGIHRAANHPIVASTARSTRTPARHLDGNPSHPLSSPDRDPSTTAQTGASRTTPVGCDFSVTLNTPAPAHPA
jgi:hypothetical protein